MTYNMKFRFQTILVATDLGENASSALNYAQALAHAHEARIVITHVIDPVGYAFPSGLPASLLRDTEAREEVRRMEEATRRQGIDVHSQVQTGTICERILQSVKETHADLLILGTRAITHAGRAALGAVARQLLSRTPCPVLTVSREAEKHLPRTGCWRRVLIATDFSAPSLEALDYAHRVTVEHLTVMHVEPCHDPHEGQTCLERLRFLAPFNELHTVPVEHLVVAGDPPEIIAREAQQMQADLVVLGSPVDVLEEHDFLSSTVLRVISEVKCPVLCVPSTLPVSSGTAVQEVANSC